MWGNEQMMVYKLFTYSKDFGFKDQITRSSFSVASNIEKSVGMTFVKETDEMLSGLKRNYV